MAAFANRVRGRVPLEKDFAQERADWYNVMPTYLLVTEREFITYSSQSHWPRCLLFPCSLACSCRHCKVQGAVASSICSSGRRKVVTLILLEEVEDPHVPYVLPTVVPVQLITCKKTRTCTTKVQERMRETESIESPLHVLVAR